METIGATAITFAAVAKRIKASGNTIGATTATFAAMVETIESCGALRACADQAKELIESAWAKADPSLEPSLTKIVLRAFGWYVLERHY